MRMHAGWRAWLAGLASGVWCARGRRAVRVKEAAEAHDGLSLGRVLCEVQRLGDRHVEPAGQDLLLRLPVVRRRDELDVQARIGKVALAQSDHQRQVVGIEEPLEAKLDGGGRGRGGGCHEEMFAILEVRGPNGEPPPEDMRLVLPPRVKCPLKRS